MNAARETAVVEMVRNHEDDLRDLAETDLRCAKYAKALLELADENGGVIERN